VIHYFLVPLADDIPGVNVFRYISIRTAWSMLTALAICYIAFPPFIERLKRLKLDQIIRDDGPQSHRLNKVGTPTMGGLCILVAVIVSTLLWGRLDVPWIWLNLAILVGYGAIGFVDDWKKVMHRSADGLSGRWKLLLQTLIGGSVLAVAHVNGWIDPVLPLPFVKDVVIDFRELWVGAPDQLGWLYPLFGVFMLVAMSNAVNLTDGLDGLAIGPVMTSAATYGVIAYVAGNTRFAGYLGITYVEGAGEVTVLAMSLVGAGLGFLWYNAYPASIFMGDVGSLALGGVLAMMAISTKHELLVVVVGGIFVLETVSVILQVGSFKMRGKRVFAMAPIHHHYEQRGWSEPKIIVRFWIISIILALVALSTLKLR
jgi:phospho-N-acetylmuramoyl-pentapeptide-transferase